MKYIQKIKNIFKVLIIFIIFFSFFSITQAEVINNFNSVITVLPDASISIQEKIIYDFEGESKHGIFRTIPLVNSKKEKIEINNIFVKDENNLSYPFSTSISSGILSIKIGDPNILISGIKEYHISYKVFDSISYYPDYDEIYWNVTGNDWPVIIKKAYATILLPNNINPIQKSCYYGAIKSNLKCDIVSDIFYSPTELSYGEGLTIAVGFSKGIVYEPTKIQKNVSFFLDNIIFLLPILVFIIMFLIWRKKGKDPKGLSSVMAEYEPPLKIKPTLVGFLIDEKVDNKDITAGIIYLAQQGFIKISKIEKEWLFGKADYEIELINNDISKLEKTEQSILALFFSGFLVGEKMQISSFKKDMNFILKFNKLKNIIYQEVADRKFYEKNPQKIKSPYIISGVGLIILIGCLEYLFSFRINLIFSVVISGIIIIFFGLIMSRKTKLGAETKSHISGFKLFLSMTEKDRLDFHNAPEKNPEQFMEFLPYAIAFGIEKKWASQFNDIYIEQPNWYRANVAGSFMVADFASNLSGFSKSFSAATGGSGGGGFSGGGGGGGGGGSW